MKLQPAYTEWNAARARQGWIHPTAPSSAPVNSDSWHPNNRPSSHSKGRGGLGARPPLASQPRRPGFPQQRTDAESVPSASNSANVPQNAGINPEPAHDSIFRHFMSSLNPNDPSVTWINAGAFTSPIAMDLNDIQHSLFKDCVKKTLAMTGRFEREKRACEALHQLARTLPLLLLTHSKLQIRAACNKFLKGEWESLWNKCIPKVMLARINLLKIHYRHRHACLHKKTPWLNNRLGLATFPKQIRLYARSFNRHLGTILCTNYRKRHQSVQSFLTNNFGRHQMRSTRCADPINGSTFKNIRFL